MRNSGDDRDNIASVSPAVGTRSRRPTRGFSSLSEHRLVEQLVLQCELLKSLQRDGVVVAGAVGSHRGIATRARYEQKRAPAIWPAKQSPILPRPPGREAGNRIHQPDAR